MSTTINKEETVKASLLLLLYLSALGLLVNLTANNPALGLYTASALLAMGILYVLYHLARTWIQADRTGDRQ